MRLIAGDLAGHSIVDTGELSAEQMLRRGLPMFCILVSDRYCTDPAAEYDAAIAELSKQPWGL